MTTIAISPLNRMLVTAATAATLLVAPTDGAAKASTDEKVVLFHTYQQVKRILGQPLAEGPPSECVNHRRSHLMLYQRPDALLQLLFDEKYSLRMIRLIATKHPPRGARTIAWPGLDTWFADVRTYASVPGAMPVFFGSYAVGNAEIGNQARYWETQPPSAQAHGTRVFRGIVSLGFDTQVVDRGMPMTGLDVLFGGAGLENHGPYHARRYINTDEALNDSLAYEDVPLWRHRGVPNAFMWIASEPLLGGERCDALTLDFEDLAQAYYRIRIPESVLQRGEVRKLKP
jgi:hypothetical protein